MATGLRDDAHQHYLAALDLAVDTGNIYQQARAHEGLFRSGACSAFRDEHRRRARAIYVHLGVPDAERLREPKAGASAQCDLGDVTDG